MISYMIYQPGLGDSDLYVRRRRRVGVSQEYWNFDTSAWDAAESTSTKVFLTEVADTTFSSIYALTTALPDSSETYVEEVVQTSTGDVVQQNMPATGPVIPEVSYTGTTLQDTLDLVLQRASNLKMVAKVPFMSAANMALDIIYKRLLIRKSDLVKESFTISIVANTNSYALPDDFNGFAERPYFSGETILLNPLPPEERMRLTTASTPRFYEIKGTTLYLFPTPSTTFTLMTEYVKKSTAFTSLADAVPFNGLIDWLFVEAILKIADGGMGVIADPVFRQSLYSQLEEILPFRSPKQVSFLAPIENGQRNFFGPSSRDYWRN